MKLNKYEAREYRHKKIEQARRGTGVYVYRNHNDATLMLPKPLDDGTKTVAPGAEFQGDSYFMEMVKTNEIRLVRALITEEQQKMQEEKLILDQPDTVTTEGKVEQVVVKPETKPLNETPCCDDKCNESSEDVLLNEEPVDGVDFLG